ncbi:MAG: bactofilin family protein [Steroidobacteraceae bacterium]
MLGREARRTAPVEILIGRTARIQGDVDFSGGLHLDGCVTGSVRADGAAGSMLSVSKSGRIEGSVEVANVVLNGIVKGDIHATERVVLGPCSRVQGDVHYGVIEAALGAEILGRLVPATPAVPPGAAVAAAAEVTSAARDGDGARFTAEETSAGTATDTVELDARPAACDEAL